MIRYALVCSHNHAFEAWFADSEAYEDQSAAGLVVCPICGDTNVRKQIMAPAIAARLSASDQEAQARFTQLAAKVRDHIAETHEYVGDRFAEEARAIHHGDGDARPIYGEATTAEAQELKKEGVEAAMLPPALAPTPPKKVN